MEDTPGHCCATRAARPPVPGLFLPPGRGRQAQPLHRPGPAGPSSPGPKLCPPTHRFPSVAPPSHPVLLSCPRGAPSSWGDTHSSPWSNPSHPSSPATSPHRSPPGDPHPAGRGRSGAGHSLLQAVRGGERAPLQPRRLAQLRTHGFGTGHTGQQHAVWRVPITRTGCWLSLRPGPGPAPAPPPLTCPPRQAGAARESRGLDVAAAHLGAEGRTGVLELGLAPLASEARGAGAEEAGG